jgi:alanyl-tRNA synthetase
MALQGKTSNYDTDVFTPFEKVEQITGLKYTNE